MRKWKEVKGGRWRWKEEEGREIGGGGREEVREGTSP